MAKYNTEAQRNQFFDRVRQDVARCPGWMSAAWIDSLPMQGGSTQYVARRRGIRRSRTPSCRRSPCGCPSPGYFATARIPLLAGRDFTDGRRLRPARRDHPQRAHRAALLAGAEPARQARHAEDDVARAARGRRHRRRSEDRIARCRRRRLGDGDLCAGGAVRLQRRGAGGAHGRPARVAGAADGRRGARHRSRAAGARRSRRCSASSRSRSASGRLRCGCSPAFAALALVLASVGVYSVLAYTVRQRVREIGIRMALGAPSAGVLRMVVVDGLKPTLAGVALGLVLAAALVRVMETLLFGVSPLRPGHVHAGGGDRRRRRPGGDADSRLPRHPRRPDRHPAAPSKSLHTTRAATARHSESPAFAGLGHGHGALQTIPT